MALGKRAVQAINTKKIAIDGLPEAKRPFLTKKQVQNISSYDSFKYLKPCQSHN